MIPISRLAPVQLKNLSARQLANSITQKETKLITSGSRPYLITESAWILHSDLLANIKKHLQSPLKQISENTIIKTISESKTPLNKEQKQAIHLATTSSCSIINGGPGTGKSTSLATISAAIKKEDRRRVVVAAFAARIAEITAQKCNAEPYTLHALTGIKPGSSDRMETRKTEIESSIGTIIIDEAFSAEPVLLAAIFALASPHQRIILAGDPDQILPIGDGRALHDLMMSRIIPSVTLKHGHRLAASPHIAEQIERIKNGKEPISGPGLNIRCQDINDAKKRHMLKMKFAIEVHLERMRSNKNNIIITQTKSGGCGYQTINRKITGRDKPRVGDRIITTEKWPSQTKVWEKTQNRWHNGSSGKIIDEDEENIEILFDNGDHVTAPKTIHCLEFTHAISGHRAQGLEYDSALLILDKTSRRMLNKQYLVSALSRAPLLTIITDPGLLKYGAETDGLNERCPAIYAVEKTLN